MNLSLGQDEDQFHLKQALLRSSIRISDGRAKPIDLLAKYISAEGEVNTGFLFWSHNTAWRKYVDLCAGRGGGCYVHHDAEAEAEAEAEAHSVIEIILKMRK